jgi:transcriptional regulator with XRE-family HTH domain
MRAWREAMGLTQLELGELLGYCVFHINAQERGAHAICDYTMAHLSLVFAIHSLPPDAPVSILQEMLIPPTLATKRAKAAERLAQRKAKKTKSSTRKQTTRRNLRRNNPSSP